MSLATQHNSNENRIMDPIKFNLWLAIIGSTMLFAGLTSAYIVKRAEGGWHDFPIPQQFIYSSVLAILSSLTMQWAWFAAKKDELAQMKIALWSTLVLGLGFIVNQLLGWQVLVNNGLFVFFTDDVAVSFFYVITAMHFIHLLGGIIALIRVLLKSYKFEIHKTSMRAISMCTTYWHFMGILWIYLYLFLFLNR